MNVDLHPRIERLAVATVRFLELREKHLRTPDESREFKDSTAELRALNGVELVLALEAAGMLPPVDEVTFP